MSPRRLRPPVRIVTFTGGGYELGSPVSAFDEGDFKRRRATAAANFRYPKVVDAISATDTTRTPTSVETSPSPAHAKCGAIVLARHGEPDLSRKITLNAAGYGAWWANYETKGLKAGQSAPEELKAFARTAAVLISSTRPRAIETAKAVVGERTFEIDPMLVEAPLPPPHWPSWFKLSPRLWGVTTRFTWWFFDHHDGQESRFEAQRRADVVADRLAELALHGDVLVMAHGFFNTMVGRSLRRHGWKLKSSQGYKYWAMRRFERTGPSVPTGPELAAATLEALSD